MLDRAFHRFYLWAQKRQSWAKRRKDPTFRIVRHLQFMQIALPGPWPAGLILSLGPRNAIELERLAMASSNPAVVGLDLFSTDPRIRVGDMHAMPFEAGDFGMVWASHVLEHAKDPTVVFREIGRVLRPGGYLFVAYPTHFKTNWHDRWDYGDPRNLIYSYLPGWTCVNAGGIRAGSSVERFALFRKP